MREESAIIETLSTIFPIPAKTEKLKFTKIWKGRNKLHRDNKYPEIEYLLPKKIKLISRLKTTNNTEMLIVNTEK